MKANYLNRWLSSATLLVCLLSTASCSLLKILKKKDATPPPVVVIDTPSTQPVRYALLPAPDTVANTVDTTGAMLQQIGKVMPMWLKRIDYHTFNCKAKVHFEGPDDKQDFTAFIRVKKDSAIWINIFGLGGTINAARLYITHDSIFMLNYLQKELTKLPMSGVARILPTQADLGTLQNVIVGDPLRNGQIRSVAELSNSWLLNVDDSSYLQEINYDKKDSCLQVNQVNTRDPNGPQAVLKYAQYQLTSSRNISTGRTISIKNGNDVFQIDMDVMNIDFDQPVDMPFNIPKNYSVK